MVANMNQKLGKGWQQWSMGRLQTSPNRRSCDHLNFDATPKVSDSVWHYSVHGHNVCHHSDVCRHGA